MAQLMDSFMSRGHAPSVCPTHCSPHHAYLPHPSPPGPPPPSGPPLWTDTPTSMPCSPHVRQPHKLHLTFANITRSTPSPTPHTQPCPLAADPTHMLLQPHPLAADSAPLHLQHSLMPCPSHSPSHSGLYTDDALWEHNRSATL
ncbi:hypothetical protein NQD34_008705 [Periophthalmus magnuspinnatus]|nr:hypothetical protein NQD34_008705 [Periophthalmus magnuspinnatus]